MRRCALCAGPHLSFPAADSSLDLQVCEECANVKLVRETVQLSVDVEPGMPHGHVITVFEEGEADADGDPGDLNLQLHLLPHPRFRREGRDLHLTASITLLEALTGFSHEVEHLDGHKVRHRAALTRACRQHAERVRSGRPRTETVLRRRSSWSEQRSRSRAKSSASPNKACPCTAMSYARATW